MASEKLSYIHVCLISSHFHWHTQLFVECVEGCQLLHQCFTIFASHRVPALWWHASAWVERIWRWWPHTFTCQTWFWTFIYHVLLPLYWSAVFNNRQWTPHPNLSWNRVSKDYLSFYLILMEMDCGNALVQSLDPMRPKATEYQPPSLLLPLNTFSLKGDPTKLPLPARLTRWSRLLQAFMMSGLRQGSNALMTETWLRSKLQGIVRPAGSIPNLSRGRGFFLVLALRGLPELEVSHGWWGRDGRSARP